MICRVPNLRLSVKTMAAAEPLRKALFDKLMLQSELA